MKKSELPKGFPKDGLAKISGKEYITHVGLVFLINERGAWSSTIDHVERVFDDRGFPQYVEVTATVMLNGNTHTAIGDADVNNTGRQAANALPRMAHTRALNRCIRSALGMAACTAEELVDDGDAPAPRQNAAKAPPKAANAPRPATAPRQDAPKAVSAQWEAGKCPACGSDCWDNRNTATGSQPKWKCKNQDCPHPGKYAWGSWDEWPSEWPQDVQQDADQGADQGEARFDDGLGGAMPTNTAHETIREDEIPF